MRRVEEVFDVWFDSGSMPYAQVHYPFENTDWFESHNPADFIVEYIGQTRGWFYVMHVLSTALFDRPAFKSVICHGIVLGEDGQKMSKSLRNYPDVREMYDKYGADALRWFLMSSPILRGGNLIVDEPKIRDATRHVVLPLWNVWYFLGLYANAAGEKDAQGRPTGYRGRTRYESTDVMDTYLLARTGDLVRDVKDSMTALAIADAAELIQDYLDMLTNWYVRRSRDRFWEGDEQAIDVLSTCLETLCQVAAPLLPMVTEEIWKQLTGGRSVHLTDWPDAYLFPRDEELVARMDAVRQIAGVGNSLRKKEQLRARLPLAELTVVHHDPTGLEAFSSLIADELNVKSVRLLDVASQEAQGMGVEQRLSVNARAAGPRLGKQVQTVIKGAKSGDWSLDEAGVVTSGGIELAAGEYSLDLVAGETSAMEGRAVGVLRGGDFVALDTRVSPSSRPRALHAMWCGRSSPRVVEPGSMSPIASVSPWTATSRSSPPSRPTASWSPPRCWPWSSRSRPPRRGSAQREREGLRGHRDGVCREGLSRPARQIREEPQEGGVSQQRCPALLRRGRRCPGGTSPKAPILASSRRSPPDVHDLRAGDVGALAQVGARQIILQCGECGIAGGGASHRARVAACGVVTRPHRVVLGFEHRDEIDIRSWRGGERHLVPGGRAQVRASGLRPVQIRCGDQIAAESSGADGGLMVDVHRLCGGLSRDHGLDR